MVKVMLKAGNQPLTVNPLKNLSANLIIMAVTIKLTKDSKRNKVTRLIANRKIHPTIKFKKATTTATKNAVP